MWIAKVMLFSSNYQSILAQFSRRKMPDNGLYTKYIRNCKYFSTKFNEIFYDYNSKEGVIILHQL